MRIVILTTDTLHHAYFVREIAQFSRMEWVLLEATRSSPPFEVSHPYEVQRDAHERSTWFDGASPGVGEFAETWSVGNVNEPRVINRLRDTSPDLVLVFGTGRLKAEVIAASGSNLLNLHGGNPSLYRGLDSHLWSIYHRDWSSLATALHRVDLQLDRGEIFEMRQLPIHRDMPLSQLRHVNTETCVQLSKKAITVLGSEGSITTTPQHGIGRYYSHMPSALKSLCVDRFATYTRSLA